MTINQIKTEILSGLTISIALVPEAISFALLVGAAPQVGLWAAVFMALSTSIFGGRPGIISGATGATAVIMAGLVSKVGIDSLFLGVILAGLIQLTIFASGAWRIFVKIPQAAISGFLIALALMIFNSQLKYLQVGSPTSSQTIWLICVVALSAAAMVYSAKQFKFPPALSAIAVGTLIGIPFGFATVGDLSPVTASLPELKVPTASINLILAVIPYSFGMAISGLTESLLTVDSISNKLKEPGDKGRETLAQGIGNIVSGLFGTMGGCVLVGQTNLNIEAGAKNRLSSLVAALGLAIIILVFGKWIEMLPLAGLIGVMMVVVYQTGAWSSLRIKKIKHLSIITTTVLVSLATRNLAIGVISGTLVFYFSTILKHDAIKN